MQRMVLSNAAARIAAIRPCRLFSSAKEPLVLWNHDKETKVGTITLNSPSTLNALTVEIGVEFSKLCHQLHQDLKTTLSDGAFDCNAIVLRGAGNQAFSAGGDLDWLKSFSNNSVHANVDLMLQFYHSFLCVRTLLPVPVICALTGPAMGAGAGLALACDLRTGNLQSKKLLGLHFARLGMHAGMGSSHLLPQAVKGSSTAVAETLLMGKILSGQEAWDLGLLNRASDTPLDDAYELARDISTQSHPVAVRSMVQTLRQAQNVGLEAALQREALAQAMCYARDDWGRGVTAIAEKRTNPEFDPYHTK